MPTKSRHRTHALPMDARANRLEISLHSVQCQHAFAAKELLDAIAVTHQAGVDPFLITHAVEFFGTIVLHPGRRDHRKFNFVRERSPRKAIRSGIGVHGEPASDLLLD